MTRDHVLRSAAAAVATLTLVAACSRTTTTTSEALTGATEVPPVTTTPDTSEPATTAPASTAPAATSIAPDPTPAPTTTAESAPTTTMPPTTTTRGPLTIADLTLASNGILPYTFGEDAPTVVARLSEALGPVETDDVALYPIASGDVFLDDFEEVEFGWPIGRTVCWTALCVEFGGTTTDNLQFAGWSHVAGGVAGLTTATGLTVGSTQASATMNVYEGGCYSVGYGDAEGIELTLQSTGIPFVEVDDDGMWIFQTPDPDDVRVIAMEAGRRPLFLFADC